MPSILSPRFRVKARGSNAGKRLELPLAGVRKAAGKTQEQVAEAAELAQGAVSRLESQEDMMLSTLERYAAALGARLDVTFTFPNGGSIHLQRK
ncbi:MAG: helix-turn-helix domain-containing protein [Labilithrix sp.]